MARLRNASRNCSTQHNDSNDTSNSYEEVRRRRLQDNLNRFQELGIMKISKSLSEVSRPEKKSELRHVKTKSKFSLESMDLRRSSRNRGVIPSYREVDIDLREYSKSYARRSRVERIATAEERLYAAQAAEEFRSNLRSDHPSFVKSMVRSHVSSCFWLGLPSKFCKTHLPPIELKMIMEDEDGKEYDAIYIGSRAGLSGGWRGFAIVHELDEGDALVFELTAPERFKVYIFKASDFSGQDMEKAIAVEGRTKNRL